eukprot:14859975-Heterocapsa_arctica.AAC.1
MRRSWSRIATMETCLPKGIQILAIRSMLRSCRRWWRAAVRGSPERRRSRSTAARRRSRRSVRAAA